MDEIHFTYEITQQDYVEASLLLWRKLERRPNWILPLCGIVVMVVPFLQNGPDGSMKVDSLPAVPLLAVGLFLLYCGIRSQMPGLLFRQAYPKTGLQNRTFTAFISADGLRVQGVHSEWKYGWPAVLIAQECDSLFALSTGLQLFTFPKRHMTDEQQIAVRQLIAAQPAFPGGIIPKY